MRLALYPGSFDPITNGHLDVIRRAARLFDQLIVTVANNSSKHPLFSAEERLALIREAVADLPNVSTTTFSGLLVEYAEEAKAIAIVRGLRAVTDFEYEFQMALMNRRLKASVETVFLAAREEFTYTSSSILKEVARLGGNIQDLVPPNVAQALAQKYPK